MSVPALPDTELALSSMSLLIVAVFLALSSTVPPSPVPLAATLKAAPLPTARSPSA